MRFIEISLNEQRQFITDIRREIVSLHGFEPNDSMLIPWENTSYHALENNGKLIGLTEFFRYDQMYGGYKNNVFSNHYDLSSFCPANQMGHIRTLYIIPEFQKQFKIFMFLYLSGVKRMFEERNCLFFTMTTSVKRDLLTLYKKLEFTELGFMNNYPNQPKDSILLLVSDIKKTLEKNILLNRWGI